MYLNLDIFISSHEVYVWDMMQTYYFDLIQLKSVNKYKKEKINKSKFIY